MWLNYDWRYEFPAYLTATLHQDSLLIEPLWSEISEYAHSQALPNVSICLFKRSQGYDVMFRSGVNDASKFYWRSPTGQTRSSLIPLIHNVYHPHFRDNHKFENRSQTEAGCTDHYCWATMRISSLSGPSKAPIGLLEETEKYKSPLPSYFCINLDFYLWRFKLFGDVDPSTF